MRACRCVHMHARCMTSGAPALEVDCVGAGSISGCRSLVCALYAQDAPPAVLRLLGGERPPHPKMESTACLCPDSSVPSGLRSRHLY